MDKSFFIDPKLNAFDLNIEKETKQIIDNTVQNVEKTLLQKIKEKLLKKPKTDYTVYKTEYNELKKTYIKKVQRKVQRRLI
jgi:hypothetical protein